MPISFSGTNYVDTAIAQTVDGKSGDGSYDADSNHDPDGDSDGTTVEVSKP